MSMELTIERDGGSGEGIGFAGGMTVFVPFSLAGERVRVEIEKKNKRYAQARLVDVIEAAPERREPFCPHYGVCGGCSMQHMAYEKSLAVKNSRVAQTLRRIGGIDAESILPPAYGMESPCQYRNKAVFPIKDGRIGFYRENSQIMVEITRCALLPDIMNQALAATRRWLAEQKNSADVRSLLVRVNRAGEGMAALSTAGGDLLGAREWVRRMTRETPGCASLLHGTNAPERGEAIGRAFSVLAGGDALTESIAGIGVRVSARSFQQVNLLQAERLYAQALDMAALSGKETILDAYCGAGALTQMLAHKAAHALGVELNDAAVADARAAAQRNGCANVSFYEGACEDVLPKLLAESVHPQVIILDPPRKGCDARVIEAVRRAGPERIVYISCDPATLARDAAALCEGGAYGAQAARAVDLFPWTAHVETVVLFTI